jgi:Uma2 family endonuclease
MAEVRDMAVLAERPRRLFTVDEYHLITRLGDRAVISPQNPVIIRPRSEPEPDMLVLRPREVSYSRAHPTPEDVLLAIEVGDSTVRFDRIVKARLYARARIQEYWLLDAGRESVDVSRAPQGEAYASFRTHARGDSLSPLAFPDVSIAVDELFTEPRVREKRPRAAERGRAGASKCCAGGWASCMRSRSTARTTGHPLLETW